MLERISALCAHQEQGLARLSMRRDVSGVRRVGTIAAFDIAAHHAGYLADVGMRMKRKLIEHGILLRPLGSTIYVMPPYCVTAEQMSAVLAIDFATSPF